MKKLIFKNLSKDIAGFFLITTLSMTIIVWIIQAVNLLDFISEDGHSFRIYFMFTLLSLPKIFSRILPFMFFISLFYTLIKYEEKNELNIFWLNGIHKFEFLKNILSYSLFFLLLQVLLTTYIVPKTQDMARSYIRSSTMDFFPNLIKEKKFIDAISNLTLYVGKKTNNGELLNIFLKEQLKDNQEESQIIYAKSGYLTKKNGNHWLVMIDGKIINKKNKQSTVFSFEETQFNLSNYSSKTTIFPKIKELATIDLLKCAKALYLKEYYLSENKFLTCKDNNIPAINEILRRLYLPLYLPVLALIVCFLILSSKDKFNYKKYKLRIFLICTLVLVVSELSLSYTGVSFEKNLIFISLPIILFILSIVIFKKRLNYI
jgi:lipopolysaccharide export system permease protein|tara:strand:+ start:1518 stop:2642 length:1125 start_codon:yes stop_codon:yes gene_type:complete